MKKLFVTVSTFVCIFLSVSNILAGEITLAWDPPTASQDIAGYCIDYGLAPGSYTGGVDVGNVSSIKLTDLPDGKTYYFAVLAYNSSGAESPYSNEVSKMIGTPQYSLTILKSGTGTGTVSGSGIDCGSTCSTNVDPGTVVSYSATPDTDAGSVFAGWTGGGCSGTGVCITTVNESTTITAVFNKSAVSCTITANVGNKGGTISPAGSTVLNSGESKTFTITPNRQYRIARVTVDGRSVGAVTSYTFSNVVANHKIVAYFRNVNSNAMTAKVESQDDAISSAGSSVSNSGESKRSTIIPNSRYRIAWVMVDGRSAGTMTSYAFNNIVANHKMIAYFKKVRGTLPFLAYLDGAPDSGFPT